MPAHPSLTCFMVPKPFTGRAALIQENALRCLAALGLPVLVMGDEPGAGEAATAWGARHLPGLTRNGRGTPRVDAAFAMAREASETPFLCYLNADLLLPRGFAETLAPLLEQAPEGLFTGRRWNMAVRERLDFGDGAWEGLEERRLREGRCQGAGALDYFVFPREAFRGMPPFAVGRPGWDNWMVFQARAEGRPVVDLSAVVAAVHQDHDYAHLPGGEEEFRNGEESLANRHMAGGYFHLLCLDDATHRAAGRRLVRRWCRFSVQTLSRWALGISTGHPWLRDRLRAARRGLRHTGDAR